jgi:hypothetical protein
MHKIRNITPNIENRTKQRFETVVDIAWIAWAQELMKSELKRRN